MSISTEFVLDIKGFTANLNKVVAESEKAGAEVAKAFQDATSKGLDVKVDATAIDGLVSNYRKAQAQTKLFIDEQKEVQKALKFAGQGGSQAYNEIEKQIKEAEAELQKFNTEIVKTDKVSENIGGGAFANFGESIKKGRQEASEGGGIFASLGNSIGALTSPIGLATAGIGALTGLFVSSAQKGVEYNKALGDLQAKTGLVGAEFEKLKQASEDAFSKGVGESVADATKIIGNAQTQLGSIFNPDELSNFTSKANALGRLFDKDVNEIISRATPFIKQFGLEGEEAFNLLAKSFKEGGTASDDILDSLAEYSQLAKLAGFNAQEFTDILTRGAQEGVFNTDKIADSLKEAQIRLNAGDYKKAFDDIIKGSVGVENSIAQQALEFANLGNTGAISIKDALQGSSEVIKNALESGEINEAFASQLQVAIAGTPAEDLGFDLYNRIFSAPIDTAEVSKKAAEVGKNIENAVGQRTFFETVQRQFDLFLTSFGQGLISFANNVLQPAFEGWWIYFDNAFVKPFQNIWQLLVESFKPLVLLFEDIFGGANKDAIQFRDVMSTIGKVVGILVNVALIPLRAIIQNISNVIKTAVSIFYSFRNGINELQTSTGFLGTIIQGITKYLSDFSAFWSKIINQVTEFFDLLGKKPQANIKEGAKNIGDLAEASANANKETTKLNETIVETGDSANKGTKKAKSEYKSLADFIESIKTQIAKIEFGFELSDFDTTIKQLDKQIAELNNSDLSGVAKIDTEFNLNVEKARIEVEKELKELESQIAEQIATADKDLADKRKEMVETEIDGVKKITAAYSSNELAKATQETTNLIEKIREQGALKEIEIVEKLSQQILTLRRNTSKESQKIIDDENKVLQQLRIENISDEVTRSYEAELFALTEKFDAEQKQYKDNFAILTELETKFINDFFKLQDKYKKESGGLTDILKENAITIGDAFSNAFKTKNIDNSFAEQRKEIESNKIDLLASLKGQEMAYSAYVGKVEDLQKKETEITRTENENRANIIQSAFKGVADSLNSITEITINSFDKLFEPFFAKTKENFDKLDESQRSLANTFKDTTSTLETVGVAAGLAVTASLGEALANGENWGTAFLKTLFDVVDKALNLWAVEILAKNAALTFGLGTPVALGIIATLKGLLAAARSGFKEGGYTGDGNVNEVAGVVHKKEYVVNAKQYAKHKDLIGAMEKNKLTDYFVNNYGDLMNLKGLKFNELKIKSYEKDNKSIEILSQSVNRLSSKVEQMALATSHNLNLDIKQNATIKGNDLALITDRVNRKKLVRF